MSAHTPEREKCIECGSPVPKVQTAPYRGHNPKCSLRARWRAHDVAVAAWRKTPEFKAYAAKWEPYLLEETK